MAQGVIRFSKKYVLIWENDGQYLDATTKYMDLTPYDALKIDWIPYAGETHRISQEFLIKKPLSGNDLVQSIFLTQFHINQTYNHGTSTATVTDATCRRLNLYSGGIVFENGQMYYGGSSYLNWNSRSVPMRIYGVIYN